MQIGGINCGEPGISKSIKLSCVKPNYLVFTNMPLKMNEAIFHFMGKASLSNLERANHGLESKVNNQDDQEMLQQ